MSFSRTEHEAGAHGSGVCVRLRLSLTRTNSGIFCWFSRCLISSCSYWRKKKKKLSKALLQSKLTWKKHVFVVFFQHSSFFSWNIRPVNAWVTPQTGRVIKTIAKLYTEVNKNILVSSSHLCPDLLQLLLPLAELCLQVWGPPLSHLLLPVQLQSALLQHSLQLRLLLQQQAPAPSTTHKYNVPCWALQGGCF